VNKSPARPLRAASIQSEAVAYCPECLVAAADPTEAGTLGPPSTVSVEIAEMESDAVGHVRQGSVKAIGWTCDYHDLRLVAPSQDLVDEMDWDAAGLFGPIADLPDGRVNLAVPYTEAGLDRTRADVVDSTDAAPDTDIGADTDTDTNADTDTDGETAGGVASSSQPVPTDGSGTERGATTGTEVEKPTTLVDMHETGTADPRRVDRRTMFGNPFRLEEDGGDYTREESVAAYLDWFRDRLDHGDPDAGISGEEFRAAVEDLRGETLGCWCVPDLCHAHDLLYYLDTGEPARTVADLREWGAPQRRTTGENPTPGHDCIERGDEADDNRISLSWSHNDQHVDAVVLDDTSYSWIMDVLDEARGEQDHLTVEQAWDATGVEIPALPLVVTEAQVTRGTGTGRQTSTEVVVDLDPDADAESEQWDQWQQVVQRAGDHQLTHYKNHMWPPEGEGYEPGDQLTLHEYIDDWHAIDARDVATEAELADLEIGTALSVGDVVTVANGRHRDDLTERQGVIRDVDESGAEITWDGHNWSALKRDGDGQLRVGRAGAYSPVRELEAHRDLGEITDDLLDVREDVMDSLEVDQQARSYEVTVERTWETSGAVEADRASDLHAEVTVGGPELDDPVTVHCRNVFDFGWTASVDGDLNDDVEAVVKRAARNNSPIPTGVRL